MFLTVISISWNAFKRTVIFPFFSSECSLNLNGTILSACLMYSLPCCLKPWRPGRRRFPLSSWWSGGAPQTAGGSPRADNQSAPTNQQKMSLASYKFLMLHLKVWSKALTFWSLKFKSRHWIPYMLTFHIYFLAFNKFSDFNIL